MRTLRRIILWSAVLCIGIVVLLVPGTTTVSWACQDCAAGGEFIPCSLCSACFKVKSFSKEARAFCSADTGDKLGAVTFLGPYPQYAGNPPVIYKWTLCVTCDQYICQPDGKTERKPVTLKFEKYGSTSDGTYGGVGTSAGSSVTVSGANMVLRCANGWTVGTGGSIFIKDPTGRQVSHQTFSGNYLTGVESGKDSYTRAYALHDWNYDGQQEDYATLITRQRGTTVIEKTYFKYTESQGVLVRKRITEQRFNSDGSKQFLTTLYGYYGPDHSYEGNLKFVVRPEGVKRCLAAKGYDRGIAPDHPENACGLDDTSAQGVPDDDLDDYAEVVYTAYDAQDRVTEMTRSGCGGCSSGIEQGQYAFAYVNNANYPVYPTEDQRWNTWKRCRRITMPNGLRIVEFLNMYDQVIFDVVQEMSGTTISNRWITHYLYYSDADYRRGRFKEQRLPSACAGAGYTFQDANGWTETVTPNENGATGLVRLYDYHDPSASLAWAKVRQGTKSKAAGGNDELWVRKATYVSHTYGELTIYLVENETVYPTESATEVPSPTDDRQTTEHTYTFYADSNAVELETIESPAVSTDKNGSGAQTQVVRRYKRDTQLNLYYNDWTKYDDKIDSYSYSYQELGTGDFNFGEVVTSVEDADPQGSGVSGFPNGWANTRTDYVHQKTTYAYCGSSGSPTLLESITHPGGLKTFYAYMYQKATGGANPVKETTTSLVALVAPHMDGQTPAHYDYAPVQIAVTDLDGRPTIAATGDSSDNTDGNLADDWYHPENADIAQAFNGTLRSKEVSNYEGNGQLTSVDRYYDVANSKKLTTTYAFGTASGGGNYHGLTAVGRQVTVTAPDGTITYTVYDKLGRVAQTWMGTNAAGASQDDPDGQGAPNNLKKIRATIYDQAVPGTGDSGVGDGNVTQTKTFYADASSYDTVHNYDWRNRLTKSRGPDSVASVRELDNLGRVKESKTYANATLSNGVITVTDANLRAKSETRYDEKGQVYETVVYEVQPSTGGTPGAVGDHQTTKAWYDARGRLIKTRAPSGLFSKTVYDGAGRATVSYLCYDDDDTEGGSAYAGAGTVSGDTVIEQTKTHHDDAGNVWLTRHFQRHDDATGTGELHDPGGAAPKARVTYTAAWFDILGRTTRQVHYGTNADAVIDEKPDDFNPQKANVQGYTATGQGDIPEPNTSDKYIVAVQDYDLNDNGQHYDQTTDNKGVKPRTYYDDLGRTVKVIENYVNGTVANDDTDKDRTTEYVFDSKGRLAYLKAVNAKGAGQEDQKTHYVYGDSVNASRPTAILYPDTQTIFSVDDTTKIVSITSGSDHVALTYDRLGRKTTHTDQRVTEHTFEYRTSDGRPEKDRVTALGGADDYVRAVRYVYDDVSRVESVTGYANSDCTTARSAVKFTWNGWGRRLKSRQNHAGAADAGGFDVQYAYEVSADANHEAAYVRFHKVTYPGPATPREVYYNYPASGDGAKLGRLNDIADGDGANRAKYAEYTYLGAGTVVNVAHAGVTGGLALTYKATGSGNYPGFDRFGRVVWQRWAKTDGTVLDRYFYGYDRASNRLWRAERPDWMFPGERNEAYEYDGLHRLKKAVRGTLPSGPSGASGTLLAAYPGDNDTNGQVDDDDVGKLVYDPDGTNRPWADGDFGGDGGVDDNDVTAQNMYYENLPARDVKKAWEWTLDALGNWGGYREKANGESAPWDLDQTRLHNKVNEIDNNDADDDAPSGSISGGSWILPQHDAAGNMVKAPKPGAETTRLHFVYDAWNRLVAVKNDSNGDPGTTVALYRYDGLGRRIAKLKPNSPNWDRTDYYYTESWQVLEERFAGAVSDANKDTQATVDNAAANVQYVWDIWYIDAPVLRWRDTDSNGTLDETLYYCNDANMNVTALVNTSGTVVERYLYDPYGKPSFFAGDWTPRQNNVSAYANEVLFCGYRFNPESGIYDVRRRPYNPALGRWLTRDPVGYRDSYDLYEYVAGSPVDLRDPMGDLMGNMNPWAEPNREKSFIVYSEGDTLLTPAWAAAAALGGMPEGMVGRGGGTKGYGATSVEDAVNKILKQLGPCDCIKSIEFWGHGSAGVMRVGKDGIGARDFSQAASNAPPNNFASMSALRGRMCKPCSIYFRGCNTFKGKAGAALAENAANFLQCKVAGHVTVIAGLFEPGKRELDPGGKAKWPPLSGFEEAGEAAANALIDARQIW